MNRKTSRGSSIVAGLVLAGSVLFAACASQGSGAPSATNLDAGGDATEGHDAGGSSVRDAGRDTRALSNDDGGHEASVLPPQGCDVSCTVAGGQCIDNGCVLEENPGKVTPAVQTALQQGGSADPLFKWLYPYDATVFPRGLISPTLQFDGTAPDAVMVHITYSSMKYYGFFAGSNPGRVQLPDNTWIAITQNAVALDSVDVEVTKISGGKVTGPIKESWSIAQGNMRGRIYYETYGSAILPGGILNSVGIMMISPGAAKPTPIASGCGNVCHTASADGSTLVSSTGPIGVSSISYDLTASPPATIYKDPKSYLTYGGIYPDGSFAMSATHYRTWFGNPSRLYDTKTGANIPAAGWDSVIKNAGTSAFSPDGKLFAFNYEDMDNGHTIAIAHFDNATKTFSGIAPLATDMQSTLAWPAFTPDTASVVFHAGSSTAFETDADSTTGVPNTGDIYRADVASKTVTRMDALDGYSASGGSYLPDNDTGLSFAPTVLPEAVGGYFWVIFTSHRSYGNLAPSMDNGDQNGKLWVAAIDINGDPGKDSSHPGFYLDGQESVSDNLRGFWVLSPCTQQGTACGAGDECCTGFCRQSSEGGAYSCVAPPVGSCAHEYEKCTKTSDCCDASAGYSCIGGFCAAPPPK